jgi:endonuclease/exonuclease/phosphatase family metal-dependent hydrolase
MDRLLILGLLFGASLSQATLFNCSIVESVEDRRPDKSKWTIAQYNVEWLFTEPYENCPGDGCAWNSTAQEYDHLQSVAKVVADLNADTIHMCEIQSCTQLTQLIELLPDKETYKPYLIQGTDSYTGQNVGLISRIDPVLPLSRTEDRMTYPVDDASQCMYTGSSGTTGVSKHLITTFSLQNGKRNISLVGAHLLSNPNDPLACVKREAQAQVLQNTIASIQNYYDVIVLGDFNDFDSTVPDMNNNQPNSRVLSMLKGQSGSHANQYNLSTVGELAEQSDRYTNWYDPNLDCQVETEELSAIDHILLSPNLLDKVKSVNYYHGYEEGCNISNSDHYPIVITLNGL